MLVLTENSSASILFQNMWPQLRDSHVRALAWLLTSPDLLNADATCWKNKVARLELPDASTLTAYLSDLDQQPQTLHAFLAMSTKLRLGHYAEKLLEFFLREFDSVFAVNLQIREDNGHTLGEFDFLLNRNHGLSHLELATKFYLFQPEEQGGHSVNHFLGPNLADSLGLKLEKILQKQLHLSDFAVARKNLPHEIINAQALIKGWLFYPYAQTIQPQIEGLNEVHCRGYWCTIRDLDSLPLHNAMILPRIQWLAPALATHAPDFATIQDQLRAHFLHDQSPVLLASMVESDGVISEAERFMVVSDDWELRAKKRLRQV